MHVPKQRSLVIAQSIHSMTTKANAPLLRLKILECLRASDNDGLIELVSETKERLSTVDDHATGEVLGSILHYVVQVGSLSTLQVLLDRVPELDINKQDSQGNTPLHLAALSARDDMVQLLLSQPGINDTILNDDKKQAVELANEISTMQLMSDARTKFVELQATRLRSAFEKRDFTKLQKMLQSTRVRELLDLNGMDPVSGDTVLHEFIKKNDYDMCKFILANGGDPFRRNAKGKLPIDLVHGNAALKKLLKDSSQEQNIMDPTQGPNAGPPTFKGFLKKWTNFATGYKLRWFILDSEGRLSYYKSPNEINESCRGVISLANARLKLDSSEKLKFEIEIMPSKAQLANGTSPTKWHLKANHYIETNRWVWFLQNAITAAKDSQKEKALARKSFENSARSTILQTTPRTHQKNLSSVSVADFDDPQAKNSRASSIRGGKSRNTKPSPDDVSYSMTDNETNVSDFEDGDADDDGTTEDDLKVYEAERKLVKNSLRLELASLKEFWAKSEEESSHTSVNALNTIDGMLKDYEKYTELRIAKLTKSWKRQKQVSFLWEDSIRRLDSEMQNREKKIVVLEDKQRDLKRVLKTKLGDNDDVSVPGKSLPGRESEPQDDEEIRKFIEEDNESGDEFFDADDGDEVSPPSTPQEPEREEEDIAPNVEQEDSKVPEIETTQSLSKNQLEEKALLENEKSFNGYEDPIRTTLSRSEDRPKLSLWGILKSMVGKDMTKMTLPVSFNECTSLLQRVAEDMEYVDVLNKAVQCEDSCLRMVYVAAFAASEYASTIGRIAKPFNPLLGETFEYSRPDKGYRFFVEQVSHHPPISALIAESPFFDYYGESNVDSKFYGRSFDIRHLGRWYLKLRLSDGTEELYSWKKVTSSVVGIIMGNPQVDNYGDKEIINHKTGDKAVLSFKQRGWRASSAYEVKGGISNSKGVKKYAVGGHWNSKLFAKKVSNDGSSGESFLIWQVNDRPQMAFNLTSFAASLNYLTPNLHKYLAQTDTRLRPDQRAMEDGRYDDASKEKDRVEQKQRKARALRQQKDIQYKPVWFVKKKHPATGEGYWEFNGKYWAERANGSFEGVPDIF